MISTGPVNERGGGRTGYCGQAMEDEDLTGKRKGVRRRSKT